MDLRSKRPDLRETPAEQPAGAAGTASVPAEPVRTGVVRIPAPAGKEAVPHAVPVRRGKDLGLWRHKGFFLAVLDGFAVAGSFMLAYFMRFHWPALGLREVPVPPLAPYLQGALLLAVLWVFFIHRDRGYASGFADMESLGARMRIVFTSGLYALGVLMAVSFWFRPLLLSRQVYLVTWVLSLVLMYLSRLLFRAVEQDLAAQGYAAHRVLLAGTGPRVEEFAALAAARSALCRIVGRVDPRPAGGAAPPPARRSGPPFLGGLEDLPRILRTRAVDKLVFCGAPQVDRDTFMEVLNLCESKGVDCYTLPDRFDIAVEREEVGAFSGVPMIRLRDASVRPGYALLKRCMDVAGAVGILVAGLPVWLAVALAVKLYDRGPVFFVQERAGLHGRPFRMVKFRTMVPDAEERLRELVDLERLAEPVFKLENDPRVTPLGRFLRRTGLDEIPQLLNVLRGEMSLVGPRPEEAAVVARYTPWQRRRLKAVPGITGLQQVHNRGEPDLTRRIEYDLLYLKHQGLLLDLYILAKTVKVILRGEGRAA